jgi:1,4-dihydroxy-2-naphthoyl-CoA hydrolase
LSPGEMLRESLHVVNADAIFLVPLLPHLAFDLEVATESEVVVSWSVVEALHQPTGILHGGVHCLIAEGTCSLGATLWFGDRGPVVGVSNTTDFFRAVTEGRLRSRATPVDQGSLSQVWVMLTHDEGDHLVARSQVRLQNLSTD